MHCITSYSVHRTVPVVLDEVSEEREWLLRVCAQVELLLPRGGVVSEDRGGGHWATQREHQCMTSGCGLVTEIKGGGVEIKLHSILYWSLKINCLEHQCFFKFLPWQPADSVSASRLSQYEVLCCHLVQVGIEPEELRPLPILWWHGALSKLTHTPINNYKSYAVWGGHFN